MMDCAHYRRAILADPRDADPQLRDHRDGCTECARYTERLLRFEGRFEQALRVSPLPVRARLRGSKAPRQRFLGLNPAWLAMAASVLIVLSAAFGLWLGSARSSLAADVVAHMAGEPQAWARSDVAVAPKDLAEVLKGPGMHLAPSAGMVSYARSCRFRGHLVPHLVVQTDMGPITVMVLVHESVRNQAPFDEEGYRGVILPVPGHGSLAVLAQSQSADAAAIQRVAARVRSAVDWSG